MGILGCEWCLGGDYEVIVLRPFSELGQKVKTGSSVIKLASESEKCKAETSVGVLLLYQ